MDDGKLNFFWTIIVAMIILGMIVTFFGDDAVQPENQVHVYNVTVIEKFQGYEGKTAYSRVRLEKPGAISNLILQSNKSEHWNALVVGEKVSITYNFRNNTILKVERERP